MSQLRFESRKMLIFQPQDNRQVFSLTHILLSPQRLSVDWLRLSHLLGRESANSV